MKLQYMYQVYYLQGITKDKEKEKEYKKNSIYNLYCIPILHRCIVPIPFLNAVIMVVSVRLGTNHSSHNCHNWSSESSEFNPKLLLEVLIKKLFVRSLKFAL